jgi:hypothetical protein
LLPGDRGEFERRGEHGLEYGHGHHSRAVDLDLTNPERNRSVISDGRAQDS